ncbi:N-acetyltransferase [Candidatus Parcubacteria bacterium]|nr:MAG: N-acetyltransferase [Candidatus Parcubacteria bacterium]GIW68599.1 MAG: hypothetical protein KatS3mg100_093 [Candidatus Parcubacteria bacterium]
MDFSVRSALFLRGEVISLHPLISADIPYYVRWLNDPEVRRYFPFHIAPVSEAQAAHWVEAGALVGIHQQTFTITSPAAEPVGAIGFREISYRDRRALVDIVFAVEYLHQTSYYTDALHLIASYAFDNESLNKLVFEVPDDGAPALVEALRAVGGYQEAHLASHIFLRGVLRDMHLWALFADAWRSQRDRGGPQKTTAPPAPPRPSS